MVFLSPDGLYSLTDLSISLFVIWIGKLKRGRKIPLTTSQMMIKAWCLSIAVISDDEDRGDEVNPLPNKHDTILDWTSLRRFKSHKGNKSGLTRQLLGRLFLSRWRGQGILGLSRLSIVVKSERWDVLKLYFSFFTLARAIPLAKRLTNKVVESIVTPTDSDQMVDVVNDITADWESLIRTYVPRIGSIPMCQGITWSPEGSPFSREEVW